MADYIRPNSVDNYRFAVARGQIQGATSTGASGHRENLSAGTLYDVWEGTLPICVQLSSAERLEVTSTSASDVVGGSGGEYLVIQGLDNDYNQIEEIVTLTGLTVALTNLLFLRVNACFVRSVNVAGNLGDISLTSEVTGVEIDLIGALQGFSSSCKFTVPAGYTGILTSFNGGAQRNDDADLILKVRIPSITGNSYSSVLQQPMSPVASGLEALVLPLPEKSDVKISVKARTQIVTLTASFSITIIPN